MADSEPAVLLIAGSPSDLDLVLRSQEMLDRLQIRSEIRVQSAHRTPEAAARSASDAERDGFDVIIAFAGMAAHLAGVCAAHTLLPVIAVPVASGALGGVDAALACLQMPPGTPLAAVAIDGARNASLLAARILAVREPALRAKLREIAAEDLERYDEANVASEIEKRKQARRAKAGR
ncbi:MAG: 5-(carboxyamino)imidazole ribonucleotide mutase [Deltaproteobacteria bacterium]|nr:5-(carboxyamino)imidazole ribonucleotide mutase [Deltaproteobacteria bacterium]MBW2413464.1 5-(carboxyamino)imidazole ribonucleotide mutase [Deltaproteobacteria bacterium]